MLSSSHQQHCAFVTIICWSKYPYSYKSMENNTQSMTLLCKAPVELLLWDCLNTRISQNLQSKQQLRLVIHSKGRKIPAIGHFNSGHSSTYTIHPAVQVQMELFLWTGSHLYWDIASQTIEPILLGWYHWSCLHSNPNMSGKSWVLLLLVVLQSRHFLCAENNDLTGSLPSELGQLTQLAQLAIGTNHLSNTVPTESAIKTAIEVNHPLQMKKISGNRSL